MTVFTIDSDVVDYPTFTALYDDKDAGNLVAGNVYRVAWSGDAYVADGEFITGYDGTDFTIHPFQTNKEFPAWLWDTADWTAIGDAVFIQDGDGRPGLSHSVANGDGDIRLSSRYTFRRPRSVKMYMSVNFGTRSADDRWGLEVANQADPLNDWAVNYVRYTSATGLQTLLAVGDGGTSTSANGSTTGGASTWAGNFWLMTNSESFDPVPNWTARLKKDGASLTSALTASLGHGDWGVDGGYDYQIELFTTFEDAATQAYIRSIQVIAASDTTPS